MSRSIAIQVYRFEPGADGITNRVTLSYPEVILSDDIMAVDAVNVQGGQDVIGLPYLYSKIIKRQPGVNQELFLMNSVLDIQNKMNL